MVITWMTYRQVRHLVVDLKAVCGTEVTGWTDEPGATCRACLTLLHAAQERAFLDA